MRIAHIVISLILGLSLAGPAWSQSGRAASKMSQRDINRVESLRAFEQRIEDAISRRDHVFLDRITAPTFNRTDHNGKVEDRAAVFAQIRKPPPSSDIIRRK